MRVLDAVLGAVSAEEGAGVCHCGRRGGGGCSYDAAFQLLACRKSVWYLRKYDVVDEFGEIGYEVMDV